MAVCTKLVVKAVLCATLVMSTVSADRPRIVTENSDLRIRVPASNKVYIDYDVSSDPNSGVILSDTEVQAAIDATVDGASPTADTLATYLTALDTKVNDLSTALAEAEACLVTCPAGQYVSSWCSGTTDNQCSACSAGTYSDSANLDSTCAPCDCPPSFTCDAASGACSPSVTALTVLGMGDCGPGQWKMSGFWTGCWDGTNSLQTKIDSGDKENVDRAHATARSFVTVPQTATYTFSCSADDRCGISIRKLGHELNGWTAVITMWDAGCCQNQNLDYEIEAGDYEFEYIAYEDVGGFYMNFEVVLAA